MDNATWADVTEQGSAPNRWPHVPQIIGVTGYKRSGKDSVARVLGEMGYERLGFADPVKEMALAIDPMVGLGIINGDMPRLSLAVRDLGWERAKGMPEVRRLLQRVGTEAGRGVLGDDVWITALRRRIQPGGWYVIADMRFPNEAEAVRSWGGTIWRVGRPGTESDGHPSEACVDDIVPDQTIHNTGTLDDLAIAVRGALMAVFDK